MLRHLALAALLLPTASLAQFLWHAKGARVETALSTCHNAMVDLSVTYFVAPDATSFAAVQIAGTVQALVQDVSGKGQMHLQLAPDLAAADKLVAECRAKRPGEGGARRLTLPRQDPLPA